MLDVKQLIRAELSRAKRDALAISSEQADLLAKLTAQRDALNVQIAAAIAIVTDLQAATKALDDAIIANDVKVAPVGP